MSDVKIKEVLKETVKGNDLTVYKVKNKKTVTYSYTLTGSDINDEASDFSSKKEARQSAVQSLEEVY